MNSVLLSKPLKDVVFSQNSDFTTS